MFPIWRTDMGRQMAQDGLVYGSWATGAQTTPVPWDYQAQIGSYQGTMEVTRVSDGRLRIRYDLNNTLSWRSAFLPGFKEIGSLIDVDWHRVTQHFIWTEYVSG